MRAAHRETARRFNVFVFASLPRMSEREKKACPPATFIAFYWRVSARAMVARLDEPANGLFNALDISDQRDFK